MNSIILILVFSVLKLILCNHQQIDKITDIAIQHALNAKDEPIFETKASFHLLDKTIHPSKIQISLSPNEKSHLFNLAKDSLWYRLKLTTNRSDNTFLTSTKACMLINAKLTATLIVSLDRTNTIIGFNFHPNTNQICDTISETDKIILPDKILINVLIQAPDNAILPDTFSFLQKLEAERELNEKAAVNDNRSFIAKYWMYILPIFVFMFLSALNNPENMEGSSAQTSTSAKTYH